MTLGKLHGQSLKIERIKNGRQVFIAMGSTIEVQTNADTLYAGIVTHVDSMSLFVDAQQIFIEQIRHVVLKSKRSKWVGAASLAVGVGLVSVAVFTKDECTSCERSGSEGSDRRRYAATLLPGLALTSYGAVTLARSRQIFDREHYTFQYIP